MSMTDRDEEFNAVNRRAASETPEDMGRRRFLRSATAIGVVAAPMAGAALAAQTIPAAALAQNADRAKMIRVIEQLEAWQGWEPHCVAVAKGFAAWKMRQALGLDLPDPEYAQTHIDYQRSQFERWQQTSWYSRDLAAGKVAILPSWERALA